MNRLTSMQRLKTRAVNWAEMLHGAFIGLGFSVLAAFLGDVRASNGLLVLLICLCAGLGAVPLLHRLLVSLSFVTLGLLSVCLLTPVLRAPLKALEVFQAPVKADAIVVLGGNVQCGTATLGSDSLTRLVRGLGLWRAGYAPVITVSEQSGLIGPANCPKMSGIEQGIIERLYPQGGPQVLTLRHVTTTRDEAARVNVYAQTLGWKRVLLVTSPSHSRRAQALFQRAGLNALSVPASETRFDTTLPLPWDRLQALKILAYEWLSRLKAALGSTPER